MADAEIIRIRCPNLACRCVLAVPAATRGKLVRCGACRCTVRVPIRQGPAAGGGEPSEPDAPLKQKK